MWLYMMAFMFTSVIEQDFFRYKACRVDHGYSEEICSQLNNDNNKEIKTKVQVRITFRATKMSDVDKRNGRKRGAERALCINSRRSNKFDKRGR